MKHFLVYHDDLDVDNLFVIQAETKEEAMRKFVAEIYKTHPYYDYVVEDIYNCKFLENFINIHSKERLAAHKSVFEKLMVTSGNGALACIDDVIFKIYKDEVEYSTTRIYQFFGNHKEWAKLYIDYILNKSKVIFPEEMIQYILMNDENLASDWNIKDIEIIASRPSFN